MCARRAKSRGSLCGCGGFLRLSLFFAQHRARLRGKPREWRHFPLAQLLLPH
jgi:hypothetical protein